MYRLRFAIVMLKCFLVKTRDIRDCYELKFRVWPFLDTDFKRLFTQTYSAWAGIGRWHYVFSSDFRRAAFKNRWVPVTTAETIRFNRSIKIGEKVRLKTEVVCWNERCFFMRQIFTVAGEVRAISISEGIVRSPSGHLRPKEIFSTFGSIQESPIMPDEIKIWYSMRNKNS